jgi:protein-disulfide isomerase
MQLNIAEVMQDNVLGNPDAPVTILEYASMTCPHCAHFSMDVLPEVKERLITTGKAKLIFREFPLDQLAMKASKMARCAPRDKYFDLIEVIFRNQDRWIKAEDPEKSLMQLGTLAGMTEERMKTCINSQELEAAILSGLQEGQSKYAIKSTPTFIFNYGAETFAGGRSADEFEATVNKLSAGQ